MHVRCMLGAREVHVRYALIRFMNPIDLIGCGGDH